MTESIEGARHRSRRVLSGLLALTVLLPVLVVTPAPPSGSAQERSSDQVQRDLEEAQRERDGVADELEGLQQQLDGAEEELAAIGAQLEDARARLNVAEGQVGLAELALADAEEARDAAVEAHEHALELLAAAEEELIAQEEVLSSQLVHTFKHGSSGAQAGAMALEILRRAEDPNAFSVSMKQLETVVDVQDSTVREVFALRATRQRRSEAAASARAAALQAEADAAATLEVVEALRVEAAEVADEVAEQEASQRSLVGELRTTESETAALLERVEVRQATLQRELADARAAEEAARREAERREEERRAAEAAARAEAGGGSGSSDAQGGRLATPGAGGGTGVAGLVCPVQGAVAGRDFHNDWGYPRSGGRFHQGNDIFASRGTPVVAVDDGTVVRWNPPSAPTSLGGITVTYRIGDGSEWYNAHLDSVASGIAPGASVSRGQVIGTVGNSGNARTTPPHLHLGRRQAGSWVNPWPTISPAC